MATPLIQLVRNIEPTNTVLLFGAGSSIPSHAPTASELADQLSTAFGLEVGVYSLDEVASIIETNHSRGELVDTVRRSCSHLKPTGGLLNLPLYDWKSLYTTNYDELIEQCYDRAGKPLTVLSSDFDFTVHTNSEVTKLFKLHGTIGKDICDGHNSRLIISDTDYDHTANYRNQLYDRLKGDLAGSHLIIIGHSLQDPDIREITNRAIEIRKSISNSWKVTLLLYTYDEHRSQLYEKRGFTVCFGGIDEFFFELARAKPRSTISENDKDILSLSPDLRPVTIDIQHEILRPSNLSAMFNGWPATYSDIKASLTFERNIAEEIWNTLSDDEIACSVVLGASGVGKTTAARQAIIKLLDNNIVCWEHKSDHTLNVDSWFQVAKDLATKDLVGIVLVDEAHTHLSQINDLVEKLVAKSINSLRLICVSTKNHWGPRIKSPDLLKISKTISLRKLDHIEIDKLLHLVDSNGHIRDLVEMIFSGFSPYERRRRLVDRCESDMFVCLKNIFASEKFDDIILREYADLDEQSQDIYRHVAAMENAGIHVHRQLIIRLLGIPTETIPSILSNLAEIVTEYTISEREGVYGWKGRHPVIVGIISKYKYSDLDKKIALFSKVIESISPTYEIEVRTVRELCNIETGIGSIPDKTVQNVLLRKMMSAVPGERVPRHRLIRNLIETGEFEKAETEIRIFENDFKRDGPVARYRVSLLTARAEKAIGIMEEDRQAILENARQLAISSIRRFPYNKSLLGAYCEVGIAVYKRSKDYSVYDAAMIELKQAEERLCDPDITRMIIHYGQRLTGTPIDPHDVNSNDEE